MTNRLDHLQDNRLVEAIITLSKEMTDFKNAQYTSGRSGVKGYLAQSASTWDATGTIGSDADGSTRTSTFSIVFTGDGTQAPVMANLSFLFYVNGTDPAHQLIPQANFWSDGTRNATLQYGQISETQLTYTQPLTLTTLKAVTYFVKVFAVGSSGGAVTAVKTS